MCSALVVSKINYMLPLYGGMPDYMVVALQKKLTDAMRVVTRLLTNFLCLPDRLICLRRIDQARVCA